MKCCYDNQLEVFMQKIIILSVSVVFLVSCSYVDQVKNKVLSMTQGKSQSEAGSAVVDAADGAPSLTVLCENGSQPEVLRGLCGGEWNIKNTDSGSVCEFRWGPRVLCPSGTNPAPGTTQASCYGATTHELSSANSEPTVADCESQLGKVPKEIAYEMQCCK